MKRLEAVAEARAYRRETAGLTLALVPTMGALHDGHMALVRHARTLAQRVAVSIFVNPLQFGPAEDLERYPRTLADDLARCEAEGVDAVFVPAVSVMYPRAQEGLTRVVPPEFLTNRYCGASRPGHFTGVATVVLKLFNILQPELAVFGEKDAQQLAVIRHMVHDLDVPVTIIAHPTVREPSGLALSSRNRYLQSPEQQARAQVLSAMLDRVAEAVVAAGAPLPKAEALAPALGLLSSGPNDNIRLEYLDAVDEETFQPLEAVGVGARLVVAARVDEVRLIDTRRLE